MSEMKEYISRADELGNIHISEDVLAVIAAAAALEVEGVSALAANLGSDIAELLGKKKPGKRRSDPSDGRCGLGGYFCDGKVRLYYP